MAAKAARAPPMMRHLPEYLMEAALLGLFMISACTFTVLLEHPGSPVRGAIPDPFVTAGADGSRDGRDGHRC